jgi:lysozyme
MQISLDGIAFIEENEGFSPNTYSDNGKWAIGFGHDLLPGESYPNGISWGTAEELLLKDLELPQMVLATLVPPSCTQKQWDALCDFAYNLGAGSLRTMLAHGWEPVPAQIPRWDNENGQPNAGLLARREKEVQMFKS